MEINYEKVKKIFEKLDENRSHEPLKIDVLYLSMLGAEVARAGVLKESFAEMVAAVVCAELMMYAARSGSDTITFEDFVNEFQIKTPNCFKEDVEKNSSYYFSLNIFRTIAMMMWDIHETGYIDKKAEEMEEQENTGGKA